MPVVEEQIKELTKRVETLERKKAGDRVLGFRVSLFGVRIKLAPIALQIARETAAEHVLSNSTGLLVYSSIYIPAQSLQVRAPQ